MRAASGELSSLCMMKLCAAAAEGLPPLDRSPAELALLRGLIAPLIVLVTDASQPAPHMLACALWGMARIRPLRAAMVAAGAVAALVTVADRLLNEAKADAKAHAVALKAQQVEAAKAVEDARKKAVAAGLRADEVAEAVAAAEEDAEAAAAARDAAQEAGTGAAEYGGSVPGMLLEWCVAALWTLCTPFPEAAAASAARMVAVREGRLEEARARLAGTFVEPEPEPEPEPAPAPAPAPVAPAAPPRSMPPRGPPRRGMLRKEATSKSSASFDEAMKAQAAMEAERASPGKKVLAQGDV